MVSILIGIMNHEQMCASNTCVGYTPVLHM